MHAVDNNLGGVGKNLDAEGNELQKLHLKARSQVEFAESCCIACAFDIIEEMAGLCINHKEL